MFRKDVEYEEAPVNVELGADVAYTDPSDAREKDMDRDLDAAATDDRETLRVSYGQRYSTVAVRTAFTIAGRPAARDGSACGRTATAMHDLCG